MFTLRCLLIHDIIFDLSTVIELRDTHIKAAEESNQSMQE
jgi:hypothetical protein